jgi:hypothetical protein
MIDFMPKPDVTIGHLVLLPLEDLLVQLCHLELSFGNLDGVQYPIDNILLLYI